jgi:2-polyprenyl-6-methoxyphenol hydroxylase-like FAD-dependent oxidoreductase
MYDAIVVGARCAGAATAMLLARKGHRVLLVDRARFPSDTLSAHALRIPAVDRLRRWGVLDAVVATGAPAVRDVRFDVGPFALHGRALPLGASDAMYAPRRYLIDTILVDAAVRAGAELREGFTVHDLVYDGDRVAGIRGRAANGTVVTERAKIVIGADGMRSVVAKMVDAPVRHAHDTLTCGYYTYFEDLAITPGCDAELYLREGAMAVVVPTNDRLTQVTMLRPIGEFGAIRTDVDARFHAGLDAISAELGERVRASERAERYYGTGTMPFYIRKPYGPGWALVGDAAAHKDPILAQGMKDAYVGAELLADALDAAFTERCGAEVALAEYERASHDAMRPLYELSLQFAALAPPAPEMQALFGALRGNDADTDRLLGVMEGTLPVHEFFNPANLGRIMAEAEPELLKAS